MLITSSFVDRAVLVAARAGTTLLCCNKVIASLAITSLAVLLALLPQCAAVRLRVFVVQQAA